MADRKIKRNIPLRAALNILVGDTHFVGWFFIFFTGVICYIYSYQLEQTDFSFIDYWGEIEEVEGTLTNVGYYETMEHEDSSGKEVELDYYAYGYHFVASNGLAYEDVSIGKRSTLAKGSKLTIEYPVGKPHLSRIKGMRRELYDFGNLVFLTIPGLIGLGILIPGLIRGFGARRLLKRGHVETARLVSREEFKRKGKPVYRYIFSFQDEGGQEYQISEEANSRYRFSFLDRDRQAPLSNEQKSIQMVASFLDRVGVDVPSLGEVKSKLETPEELEAASEESEGEVQAQVIYKPSDPEEARAVKTLPGAPEIDPNGQVRVDSWFFEIGLFLFLILTFFLVVISLVVGF